MLVDEAERSRRDGRLAHDKADFATRFEREVPPQELSAALRVPAHRDDFVDAYVRWQLTSFGAPLGELDDRAFLRLMKEAPRLAPNPMAAPRVVAEYSALNRTGRLSAEAMERVRRVTATLEEERSAAERLNRPAEEFRAWVLEQCPSGGPRRLHWLLESCAAAIQGGWPPAEAKGRITRAITEAAGDPDLRPEDRRAVAAAAERLAGLSCDYVKGVSFLAQDTVEAHISTAAVQRADVARWLDALKAP